MPDTRPTHEQLLKNQLACYETIRDVRTDWLDNEKATTSNYNFYQEVLRKIDRIKKELLSLHTVEF